ncbi:MAG TPA: hypothetical protein VEA61_07450 [Allosphingosinicella sp.]|nr:hypothetical protein [Allosphingosinicella sp.]
MKEFAIVLGAALALSACSVESDEDQLESMIREKLADQGSVQEVEMKKQGDGGMTGHVIIKEPNGRVGRLACTARPGGSGSSYDWRCSPAIDEKTLQEMEDVMRAELSKRGPVLQLEMNRAGDDDHMSGFAVVKDEAGEEFRLACSATRDGEGSKFSWNCSDETEEDDKAAEAS